MFGIGTLELVIIFAVIFLLFGAKRLPELASGIGKSLKIFKDEIKNHETESLPPSEQKK